MAMKVIKSKKFNKLSQGNTQYYTDHDTLPGNFNGPHRGIASDLFGARSDESPSSEDEEDMWGKNKKKDKKKKKHTHTHKE